jgi:hypothetical protein
MLRYQVYEQVDSRIVARGITQWNKEDAISAAKSYKQACPASRFLVYRWAVKTMGAIGKPQFDTK